MNKATVKNGLKLALVVGASIALIPTVYGQGVGLTTLERMLVPTPQRIERGAEVYEAQCASCHGDEGRGGSELGQRLGADGFAGGAQVNQSGLHSIYSIIAYGTGADSEDPAAPADGMEEALPVDTGDAHPVFDHLFYQDKWAVAHYVHSLIDEPQPDPLEIVIQVREEAQFGICDPEIRAGITQYLEPEGPEQLELGDQEYSTHCASCHGAEGLGDGPAGVAVNARDFSTDPAEWVNGSSPLAIFNTLQTGIEGTSMTAYTHLTEEVRWAMVHYLRQELIPEENRQEISEEEIEAACRALSAPTRPPSIPIERAMEFLVQDADQERFIRRDAYGAPLVSHDADALAGQVTFQQSCASCHGAEGQGVERLGPYGAFPPFLFVETEPMVPASVGGTYQDVADRGLGGPHATLPDMPNLTGLSQADWKNLQAYVVQFEGQGRDQVQVVTAEISQDPDSEESLQEDTSDAAEQGLQGDDTSGEEASELSEQSPQEQPNGEESEDNAPQE